MRSFHLSRYGTAQAEPTTQRPAGRMEGRRGGGAAPPCKEAPVVVSHCSTFCTTPLSCKGGWESGLPSRTPCAQRMYGHWIVLLLSQKGAWGLLRGPTQTYGPGRRPCSSPTAVLASQSASHHGLCAWSPFPCPSAAERRSLLVHALIRPLPIPCAPTKSKSAKYFPIYIFTH